MLTSSKVAIYGFIIAASFTLTFIFIFFEQIMVGEAQSAILGLFNNPNLGLRITLGLSVVIVATLLVERRLFPAIGVGYDPGSETYICPENDKHRFNIPGYYYSFRPPRVIYMCPACWGKNTMTPLWDEPLILQNMPRALSGIPGVNAKLGEATPEQIDDYLKLLKKEAAEVVPPPKKSMPGFPKPCNVCDKGSFDSAAAMGWHIKKEHKIPLREEPDEDESKPHKRKSKKSLGEAESAEIGEEREPDE